MDQTTIIVMAFILSAIYQSLSHAKIYHNFHSVNGNNIDREIVMTSYDLYTREGKRILRCLYRLNMAATEKLYHLLFQ